MPTQKLIKKSSVKIYLVVYTGLIILAAYLIGSNYFHQLKQAEESTLSKLYGIVSTLSQQVDRGAIQTVFNRYPFDGDTSGVSQEPVLLMYSELFAGAVKSNGLKTPIYTLTYDSLSERFIGGIASNGTNTYGWHYRSPPSTLKSVYLTGGTISQFEDDHGTWLSAVYPLKDDEGNVFAVIEADYPFDSFLIEARKELYGSALISVLAMLLIGAIVYPLLNQILTLEEQSKAALAAANATVRQKNEEMTSSLEYARTIQEAMLPRPQEMKQFVSSCLVFCKPRDIVSGDFYWFHQLDDTRAFIAVADCTGHGVPGALMSIMGYNYLNEAVLTKKLTSPSKVLDFLDKRIKRAFEVKDPAKYGSDGMDIGICFIDKAEGTITFSGARRPLTVIGKDGFSVVEGVRRGIGEHFLSEKFPFQDTQLQLNESELYYLYSDGLQDQFGGPKAKKLLKKGLLNWLQGVSAVSENQRSAFLDEKLNNWKKDLVQIDDICLVGFGVKNL